MRGLIWLQRGLVMPCGRGRSLGRMSRPGRNRSKLHANFDAMTSDTFVLMLRAHAGAGDRQRFRGSGIKVSGPSHSEVARADGRAFPEAQGNSHEIAAVLPRRHNANQLVTDISPVLYAYPRSR